LTVLAALLAAVLLAAPAGAVPARPFAWPLAPRPAVTRAFDKPAQNWLPGHRGVDLAGIPDQAVLAAGSGAVAFAGMVAGKPVVSIDHSNGIRTTYEPVLARVRTGARVGKGTVIGFLQPGHLGCAAATATCLHWGARRGKDYLDPLPLVHVASIRLYPVR
jgi:murein DD-endopeptidase MepM/ murein hydrolase activator NlpD